MKTQVMVMKMLAMATTVWSAEMAMAMEVAVYDTRATLNMKVKKAPAVGFRPETHRPEQNLNQYKMINNKYLTKYLTWELNL